MQPSSPVVVFIGEGHYEFRGGDRVRVERGGAVVFDQVLDAKCPVWRLLSNEGINHLLGLDVPETR